MPLLTLGCMILEGLLVYVFLNPSEKIESNEKRELVEINKNYGDAIGKQPLVPLMVVEVVLMVVLLHQLI